MVKEMKMKDCFKPTYLCGVYNGAETGTEGWSHMALTCVAHGDNYEEIIQNYIENVRILYPFWDYNFTEHNGKWLCDGRVIEIFRLHHSFIEGKHEPYRIEQMYND